MRESVPAPRREELGSTPNAVAHLLRNVLLAEGKTWVEQRGALVCPKGDKQFGPVFVDSVLCLPSRHRAFYPAAPEKGDPSVDYDGAGGEDEYNFDKQGGGG